MSRLLPWTSVVLALVLGACVTINVYFPAAAAEKAADRIIDEVWGPDADKSSSYDAAPAAARVTRALDRGMTAISLWLIPAARAQANLEIATPAINRLRGSMKARHAKLEPLYSAGAVGLTDEGLVAVRNAKALSLAQRPQANRLVAAENEDRNALYRAIATANGHAEWEPEIRATFARRWIDKAKKGWWYESGGTWRQR
jgi:uncharacterized protein YdbL (DUF1318 family)